MHDSLKRVLMDSRPSDIYLRVLKVSSKISTLLFTGVFISINLLFAAPPSQPNVVIFFTDDQGTLDANCYGSTDLYTPNIDKLARMGVRFTQAYAHTVCCPARAPMLTGRHPQRGGINNWAQGNINDTQRQVNLFLSETTLAEVLQNAGYKTGLFGKWHLGAHPDHGPTKQGFDEFFGLRDGFIDNYNHYFLHGKGYHDLFEGTKEVFAEGEYFPDMITDRALKFIERYKSQPFFLYLAFNIPHYPEQPDLQFDKMYKDLPEPRRSYAKMISTTDDRMGQIITNLEQLGLIENTIIIFMSDNGHSDEDYYIKVDNHASGLPKGANYGANGGGGNTGKWRGHKEEFFEGGIRVPAIITYPSKLPQGVVRDQAVTIADWFPTVLDLCSLPLPESKLDGKNILSVIKSAEAPSPHKILYWQWQERWAVREGEWKLIGEGDDAEFLGNLADEQPEVTNYLKDKPNLTQRLLTLHDAWMQEVMPGNDK
jgi:arylsulfatase A